MPAKNSDQRKSRSLTTLTMLILLNVNSRYSSCYAERDLNFSDGSFGTWRLYSSGGSTFIFNRGDTVTLLYKHNQWHDPNGGTYDIK